MRRLRSARVARPARLSRCSAKMDRRAASATSKNRCPGRRLPPAEFRIESTLLRKEPDYGTNLHHWVVGRSGPNGCSTAPRTWPPGRPACSQRPSSRRGAGAALTSPKILVVVPALTLDPHCRMHVQCFEFHSRALPGATRSDAMRPARLLGTEPAPPTPAARRSILLDRSQ
jgi:hypothetical protein